MDGVSRQPCPDCGSRIEVHHGFPTWCECGWNLVAPAPATREGRFDRLSLAAAQRLDRRLGETVTRSDLQPQMTAAKAAAYTISGLVYLAAAVFVASGLWLALVIRSFLGIFVGLALVAMGVFMRPRFWKPPKE